MRSFVIVSRPGVEVDGATHRVEVDAGARAAALRVDPTNRELAIRTDHRERTE